MNKKYILTSIAAAGFVAVPFSAAFADSLPPANAQPLSTILTSVQKQGVGQIAEADFDHGRWEITVCKATSCQKLYYNPVSGAEMKHRHTDFEQTPPANSKAIVTIVQNIEAARVGVVTGIDFDHGHWQVELAVSPTGSN